jgi:nucleotide-binding universal stress UspA family protein
MPEGNEGPQVILVADDGSADAQSAGDIAIQVARCQNLSIQGLYVVDETLVLEAYANYSEELGSGLRPTSRAELIAWFEHRGQSTLGQLEERCRTGGVLASSELLFGGVPELILASAARAQMLALGRRGHGHLGQLSYLGHNFRAISHRARLPLLVGGDTKHTVQQVLLAYNASDAAQRALDWAYRLQDALSAQVLVLAVQEGEGDEPAGQWLEDARRRLVERGVTNPRLLSRHGQPAAEIVAAAVESEADLIVMGRYRHTLLLDWLSDSTMDGVLRETELPALFA